MRRRRREVKIFKSHKEQEAADIRFYVRLTPRERQKIARQLRQRCYGDETKPIRESRRSR